MPTPPAWYRVGRSAPPARSAAGCWHCSPISAPGRGGEGGSREGRGGPADDQRTAARQPWALWLCAGSFIHVPDVLEQLPLAIFPLPDDGIFERLVLRISAPGREGSGADLSRRIGAERLHVEGRQLDVAGVVLHLAGPEFLDVGPALHHRRAGRQHIGIGRVQRRYCAGIALVESGGPLVIELLDCLLALRQRRAG